MRLTEAATQGFFDCEFRRRSVISDVIWLVHTPNAATSLRHGSHAIDCAVTMFFNVFLLTATLLCSLVAGFLFAFSVVAMPGIGQLDDRSFIRAFRAMDGIIQNNQPVFIFVWVGSAIMLVVAAVVGFNQTTGVDRLILVTAAVIYVLGVQFPTARINIPLNNKLQASNIDRMDDRDISAARGEFENRWNRWNVARTIVATIVALALQFLLLRLQLPTTG